MPSALPSANRPTVPRALPSDQESILGAVLSRARETAGAVVLFDLDSTILDNRPRQARILHDYGEQAGVPALRDARPEHWEGWDLEVALANAGLSPAEVAAHAGPALRFWRERFFTSAYCRLDVPVPGAAGFVAALAEAGARIAYVTGRPERMREGTMEAFATHGFPLPDGRRADLLMNPDADLLDDAWKEIACRRVDGFGEVVAAFDNEPVHVNLYARAWPRALVVHLDTDHSGRAVEVLPTVPSVRDLRWGPLAGLVLALLSFAALAACGPARETPRPPSGADQTERPVIYGQDDRREVYQDPDAAWRALAADSLVALVDPGAVDTTDPANVRLVGPTFGEYYGLCSSEPFVSQVAAAFCSGILVGDDLVLTAGHCILGAADCLATSFVFHDHLVADGTLATLTADDVFSCSEVVARRLDPSHDHALVRLDRPATPAHHPAVVAEPSALGAGDAVTLVGFPGGIPAKIDHGGTVFQTGADLYASFEATLDAYAGNSGSPVFLDSSLEVVGILTAGNLDFVLDGNCHVSNVISGVPPSAEVSSYAFRALDQACLAGVAGAPCAGRTVCGDGVCADSERPLCPDDCSATPPGLPGDQPGGCGCASGPSTSPSLVLLLGAALLPRRRGHQLQSSVAARKRMAPFSNDPWRSPRPPRATGRLPWRSTPSVPP